MNILQALGVGTVLAILVFRGARPIIERQARRIGNSKEGVNQLFTVPLIFAAALLSFAHGSNDVANAVGPLAAIVEVVSSGTGEITAAAPIPMWVMIVGALGIAIGLGLFGPKVIRTVGSEITELDQMRAYCIAMAATLTVILASQLGLPVSTTHVAVGAVFGVGFLREYLKSQYARMLETIKRITRRAIRPPSMPSSRNSPRRRSTRRDACCASSSANQNAVWTRPISPSSSAKACARSIAMSW